MTQAKRIHIGTSGWSYKAWRGPFYPPELPASDWLRHYAGLFGSVEINNSFYHLPETTTLDHWREEVPEGFLFAAKASRYLTHMKKLREPEEPLAHLLERLEHLGEHLGPLLFQLPPQWGANPQRLEGLLALLPKGQRAAFEFRDHSWFIPAVMTRREKSGAAGCRFELAGYTAPAVRTADFSYLRLHGPGGAYQGNYSDDALAHWAEELVKESEGGREVFCYFDNDEAGYAPRNALRLQQLVEGLLSRSG